jgi:hypothetical protein
MGVTHLEGAPLLATGPTLPRCSSFGHNLSSQQSSENNEVITIIILILEIMKPRLEKVSNGIQAYTADKSRSVHSFAV